MPNIAILASHNGSGFDAIYDAIHNKQLQATISFVASNNSNAIALKKATHRKIKNYLINTKTHTNPDKALYKLLKNNKCQYVFLSGYMKKLSPLLTSNFTIINTHPSLLPKYGGVGMYGQFVHEAVIKNKEKVSGVTIHEVNEVYDDGIILLQKEIKLSQNETVQTLEDKIKILEKEAIIKALQQCLK